MELLRLAVAARRVGVHPGTLRLWANEGRVPVVWVGRERRFSSEALDVLTGCPDVAGRREALYVRVSGTSGQESSLAAREAELRASASGVVVAVFKDRAWGLRESRPGLDRLLKRAAKGEFTHVRVTHGDRLARFGAGWLIQVLAHHRVSVEVLHAKGAAGGMEELLDDFMSLVATFAGRVYGMRSREARRRLLAEAGGRMEHPVLGAGAGRLRVKVVARLMATATCTAFSGVLEGTGERVGQRVLLERVGFLAQLSRELTGALVAARWDEESLDVLAAGVDERGGALPSKGWMALRRLNWPQHVTAPAGVYVPDRVRRGAQEYAARTLRLALHRRGIVAAVLATWPDDPRRRTEGEWAALRAALPAGVSGAEIRSRTRQIRQFVAGHGRLPAGLCVLEGPPQVAGQVLLAAMDRQQVTLQRVDAATARLRVKLPLRAAPATGRDWAWHVIDIRLPGTITPDAVLHTPTLRPTPAGRIAVDLPHSRPVPATTASGHSVALGFDWGVNTLLTGTVGRLTGQGPAKRVVTDGRPLIFDATTVSAALHRLRGVREHLAAKRDHYRALADGLGPPHLAWGEHLDRARVLESEHGRVCARIRQLNAALAWAAARWAVDQAAALGASVIYLEDLTTLEARGHRRGNARLSGQVRGTVAEAIRHLAAKAGITVVTVPARGTSKLCPGCLGKLTHHPAPDRLHERGWKWAHCAGCSLSMDRDHAAARRIVSRGLLAQAHTTTERATGTRTIRTTVDGTVALVRRPKKTTRRLRRQRRAEQAPPRPRRPKATESKQRPTPSRPSGTPHRSARRAAPAQAPGHKTSRRTPDVRTVPATTPTTGTVQRPAGHDTTTPAAVSGPVPGHGVPAPHRIEEDPLRSGRVRLSRRTCRRRTRAAERTGFHHLHTTEVHPLTPRFGPPDGNRRQPRRARTAWKPQAHTEF